MHFRSHKRKMKNRKPEDWLTEIEYALEFRREWGLESWWGKLESIYYNVHPSMMNDGPNMFLSTGDTMLSTITVPTPKVVIKPRSPEAVAKIKILESLDNLLMVELEMREQVEMAALHAYLFGRGILKIGYDSEYGYDPKLDVLGDLRAGMTLSQLNKSGNRRIEHNRLVIPGMPWVRALAPHDFLVPYGTISLDNCPWIINRIIRHIDDLKADPKYSNTDRLEPTVSMQDYIDSYKTPVRRRRRSNVRDPEFVEIWEIHDRSTGKVMAVVNDHDKFIRNVDNALQIENRLPFVSFSFTPITRSFWTTPDVFYILHAQSELSDVAIQRTKQRRISTVKFIYDEDVLSPEELLKLLSPDVGPAAKVKAGGDINKAIVKMDNTIDQSLILEEEHIRRNVQEQIGFSRNQLGEFAGRRTTASEAGIVEKHSTLRMSRRGLAVKRAYEKSFEIINSIIFQHWTMPRYVEVMGPQRAAEWKSVTGPQLKSRYAYEVIFTDEAETSQRGMAALQLMQLMIQDPFVDPVALHEYLINQVNDPSFERIFNANLRSSLSQMRQTGGGIQEKNTPPQGNLLSQGNGNIAAGDIGGLLAGRR